MGNVSHYFCFYNPRDFALNSGTFLGVSTNWEKDQIDYKPDATRGISTAGYYSYQTSTGEGDFTSTPIFSLNVTRKVTDNRESMSFIARPRSQAAGEDKNSAAVFGEAINLSQPPNNFTDAEADHSGQFKRDYNQVWSLYQRFESIITPRP